MAIYETIRSDGLRIITWHVPELKRVHMELVAGVGSAYDPSSMDGLFHFFEHMAFKGTQFRSAEEIQQFRRRNVLSWGASTGRTSTWYWGESTGSKFFYLCDMLCDLYMRSIFPQDELDREKEVIKQEIARDKDNDNLTAGNVLREQLWSSNPLRKFGVGTPEGVDAVTRDHLFEAKQRWYVPSNTTIFAVGNVQHRDFCAYLETCLPAISSLAPLGKILHWNDECGIEPQNKRVALERPGREKAIVLMGCKIPYYTDHYTNIVGRFMDYLLVRGTASRIWDELREKRGLAYAISGSCVPCYPLGVYFFVTIEVLPKRISEVEDLLAHLLFQPLSDKKAFLDLKEWLMDWYELGYEEQGYYWNEVSRRLLAHMELADIEEYFHVCSQIISCMELDDVENYRRNVLRPEQFVRVVLKPA